MKYLLEFEQFIEKYNLPIVCRIDSSILNEGGAAGHLQGPAEDYDLTFGQLKEIVDRALDGTLDKESKVAEKLDGQAISISWKDGRLIAARNKGHLKNAGASALDVNGIIDKFAGRGSLSDAFAFAVTDLEKAISNIREADRNAIFNEGRNFMSVEVIFPPTTNVINYDIPRLIFHGTLEYDDNGNPVKQDKSSAVLLTDLIKEVNAHVQDHFEIIYPVFLDIPKHQDFSKEQRRFFNMIDDLKNKFKLKNNDTIKEWHRRWWDDFISVQEHKMNYVLNSDIKDRLVNRFAFDDKSLSLRELKREIEHEDFLKWILDFEIKDLKSTVRENNDQFEIIFLDLAVTILRNISGFLAANPAAAVQKIKSDIDNTLKEADRLNDQELFSKLKRHLDRIESIGGFESILPTEGIVFTYNGGTYKMTGSFAPVNQLLGTFKFKR